MMKADINFEEVLVIRIHVWWLILKVLIDKWTLFINFETLKLKTFDRAIGEVFEILKFINIILIMTKMIKVLW
jgi:hypothetical protein